jgi:epidermal growth factor receptor substrate 15
MTFPTSPKRGNVIKGWFSSSSERLFQQIDDVMTKDLPKLMKLVAPQHDHPTHNPFAADQWIINPQMKETYDGVFYSLNPKNGYLDGAAARDPLMATGVAIDDLRRIWDLCDFEKDGQLDSDAFALALFLSEAAKQGKKPPPVLPMSFVPPSKRRKYAAALQARQQQQ